nr:hypothetical protein [Hyphomonas sp. Mor2]
MSGPVTWELHGYAMTCRNDCIATSMGEIPDALQYAIDSKKFQTELDACAAVIMGRRAHETIPNPKDRIRTVMTRSVTALEHHEGGWRWNPATMTLDNMLTIAASAGGRIAVNGGQTTLEYFMENGLNVLHICRAESIAIQDGLKLLAGCDRKTTVDDVLREEGWDLAERRLIDLKAPISLSTWRRWPTSPDGESQLGLDV